MVTFWPGREQHMGNKSVGFWLGAAVLAGTSCAHSAEATRSDNNMNNAPVATRDTPVTRPETQGTPGSAPSAANDPYNGTTGSPDMGSLNNTGNPMAGTTGESGSTGTSRNLQDKNKVLANADGSQPGIIQDYSEGTLTLTSRTQGNRQTPRIQTMSLDHNVPIFSGDSRVSTDALVPGADVRVYFKAGMGDDQKQIIGVDILKATAPTTEEQPPVNNGLNE
jgi:hypothetical protein